METAGFIVQSVLFGFALAMDAFAVSVVAGLEEPHMSRPRAVRIAGCFSLFQIAMPLLGWILVKTAAGLLTQLERVIPWAALIVLVFLGSKMIIEGLKGGEGSSMSVAGDGELLAAGVATSIDALSVGLATEHLGAAQAFAEALIIGAVTYAVCSFGIRAGKDLGSALTKKAPLLGGAILIAIGLRIFFS